MIRRRQSIFKITHLVFNTRFMSACHIYFRQYFDELSLCKFQKTFTTIQKFKGFLLGKIG